MIAGLVAVGVVAIVVAAFLLLSRVKQPANLEGPGHAADPSESEQLYQGSDLPAGPDAEDPPTTVPNRREVEPVGHGDTDEPTNGT